MGGTGIPEQFLRLCVNWCRSRASKYASPPSPPAEPLSQSEAEGWDTVHRNYGTVKIVAYTAFCAVLCPDVIKYS